MQDTEQQEKNFSLKNYFVTLAKTKAIYLIVAIGFIVYYNSLFNGFVFDDIGQIVTNQSVHSITSVSDIFFNNMRAQLVNEYYKPLLFIFYAVLYTFFQENAFFYHFTQLSFHIANSILLFLIFKRFLKQWVAFFLALFFLIHPINEETVVYISNLQDVLFVFFGLFSFYLLQLNSEKLRYIIFANFFLLLSVLSKETGFLFVVINFYYILLFQRKKLLTYAYYASGVCLLYYILRFSFHVEIPVDPLVPIMRLSFLQRMMNVPEIIFYYIRTFLFPKDLLCCQSWVVKNIQFTDFVLPLFLDLLFMGLLFLLVWHLYRKGKRKNLYSFFLYGFSLDFFFIYKFILWI